MRQQCNQGINGCDGDAIIEGLEWPRDGTLETRIGDKNWRQDTDD